MKAFRLSATGLLCIFVRIIKDYLNIFLIVVWWISSSLSGIPLILTIYDDWATWCLCLWLVFVLIACLRLVRISKKLYISFPFWLILPNINNSTTNVIKYSSMLKNLAKVEMLINVLLPVCWNCVRESDKYSTLRPFLQNRMEDSVRIVITRTKPNSFLWGAKWCENATTCSLLPYFAHFTTQYITQHNKQSSYHGVWKFSFGV